MSDPLVVESGQGQAMGLKGWVRWMAHLIPAVVFLGGAWVAGCSCEDEGGGDFTLDSAPLILVTPNSLSFAAATADRPETREVIISNVGTGPLTDFTYRLQKDEGPFTFAAPEQKTLLDNESMVLQITYRPDDETADTDTLIIEASNNQRAEVLLNSLPPRRELQCEPDPTVFSGVELGENESISIDVVNIGTLPVTLSGFNMESALDLQVTGEPDLPVVLQPQERTSVEVTFTPVAGGQTTDVLRILTEEAPGLFTCNVRGTTPLPQINVTPSRIDFGSVPTGQTVTADLVVKNNGSAALEIQPPAFLRGNSPDIAFVDPPTEATTLAPGESMMLTASYTAAAAVATSTAVLVSNDPTNPQQAIPMLGRPQRPDLVVSPESIAYGNVGQGVTSTRTLSLFNNGTQELVVSAMTVNGTAEFFLEPNGNFPPTTGGGEGIIPPMGSVEVRVSYAPNNLGQDLARLTIASNDPDEPSLDVPLSGTGLEGAECVVRIRPDPLNFGLVTRGSTKVLNANVVNTGTGPCKYNSAQAQGILNNAFRVQGANIPAGAEFGPGETLAVEVAYNPTAFDLNNGKLTVNVTDPINGNSPVFCNLGAACQQNPNDFRCNFDPPVCGVDIQGTAGIADIAVIPGTVDFGLVTLGCSSQVTTVTIYNTGVAPLNVSNIRLAADCSREFALRGLPNFPVAVDANAPIPVQVIYTPADLGEDTCSMIITSDASDQEPDLLVPMRGEGTNISRQVDVFEQVSGREVDVLFVIDGSGSMSEEQSNVANNLGRFLATAELLDNDFQIGVTHLDIEATQNFRGRAYEAGELMGDPPILTPRTPSYQSEFESRVEMGATGGNREAGLEAARQALSDPLITNTGRACSRDSDCSAPYPVCSTSTRTCGGRNAGFIREDASLEIVILSDEEDQSTATPEFYVDFFRSIKGFRNEALMHVSVIVGANINSNTPAQCSSGQGEADAGRRYGVVADATNGTIGSICASNFGPFLQNIGNRAFGLRVEFFLSRAAEPATVEVRVNGQRRNSGWTFDAQTNSVVFGRNDVPQPGDTIEVEYEARCF